MRLLDLFCCSGGAAFGYRRAGFEVLGVDIDCQWADTYLGDLFRCHDALDFDPEWIAAHFHAVHASPPCQAYSTATGPNNHPDLIEPTRRLLDATGLPYVIENVVGAPLINWFQLCGSSFGLQVQRHRRFELGGGAEAWNPPPCNHQWEQGRPYTVTGSGGWGEKAQTDHSWKPDDEDHAADLMGMPRGLPRRAYTEAIPPAYAEWIGRNVLTPTLEKVS